MGIVSSLDQRFYPGIENYWDDRAFRAFVIARLSACDTILDLGAGAGILPEMDFRGCVQKVCGVDPDVRVLANRHLDEARVGTGEKIPFEDESFDAVISDNVLEHLTDPTQVFAEVNRVLKPGGRFLFKTPNMLHYMPMIAMATPQWFHKWYNALRGRSAIDTFPTVYRVNTDAAIAKIGRQVGLIRGQFLNIESRPEYLRVTALSYLVGIAYERLVNLHPALAGFRIVLIGELIKPPFVHEGAPRTVASRVASP